MNRRLEAEASWEFPYELSVCINCIYIAVKGTEIYYVIVYAETPLDYDAIGAEFPSEFARACVQCIKVIVA